MNFREWLEVKSQLGLLTKIAETYKGCTIENVMQQMQAQLDEYDQECKDGRKCQNCAHCGYYYNALFCFLNIPHAARDLTPNGFPTCIKYEERDENTEIISFDEQGHIRTCDNEGHAVLNGNWLYDEPVSEDVIHVDYSEGGAE